MRDTLNAPWFLTNRQFQWTGNGHSQLPLASRVLISTCSAPLVQTGEQFFTVWPWPKTLTYNPSLAKVNPHAKNQGQTGGPVWTHIPEDILFSATHYTLIVICITITATDYFHFPWACRVTPAASVNILASCLSCPWARRPWPSRSIPPCRGRDVVHQSSELSHLTLSLAQRSSFDELSPGNQHLWCKIKVSKVNKIILEINFRKPYVNNKTETLESDDLMFVNTGRLTNHGVP